MERRLKTADGIQEKLIRYGEEISIESAREHIMDIAGIRVVCNFIDDVYRLADMLMSQSDLKLITKKDYIEHPKPNGYRSLHLVLGVPVYLLNGCEIVPVEVQIRTVAMDFWASLEHKIYYKFEGHAPEYISADLKECADMISALDDTINASVKKFF